MTSGVAGASGTLLLFFWRSPWQELCGSDIWLLSICAGVLLSRISGIAEAVRGATGMQNKIY